MPSRFIVSCTARAVGTTRTSPALSSAARASVASASISGITTAAPLARMAAVSASGSLMSTVRALCATCWAGAPS